MVIPKRFICNPEDFKHAVRQSSNVGRSKARVVIRFL